MDDNGERKINAKPNFLLEVVFLVSDRTKKLNAMVGGNVEVPKPKPNLPRLHFKHGIPSGLSPNEFLVLAPKKFKADIVEPEGTWTITYTLYHKTDSCLTYVAQLKDLKETYLAPIYLFKQECGYQRRLMKRIYQRENPSAWQVISGGHFHHELGPIVFKNELDPFIVPLKVYLGFELYAPITNRTTAGGDPSV